MLVMKVSKYTKYADKKQASLHTRFPNSHFLANKDNCEHALLWNTFYRRNLHRFAMDYLGLKLHMFQIIILYFMGICPTIAIIASRAASKSFIIAIYSCCKCILYPHTEVVVASATKKQAKLIVTSKIQKELMAWSPMLRREISSVKDNGTETIVTFRGNSTITVCVGNDTARGYRSTVLIREEFRMIDKHIDDSVLSPFQVVRQVECMLDSYYKEIAVLKEPPTDIYISSSWLDNGHWMWKVVDDTANDMLNNKGGILLSFDESIILKSGIKLKSQLLKEKKKLDPLTWRMEYLNERVLENSSAFFTYSMFSKNQRCKQVFYPNFILSNGLKIQSKSTLTKQNGEIRIVACDIAFVQNKLNDNSIYSCIRLIPEKITHQTDKGEMEIQQGYRRSVPYIQSCQGGDTFLQALAIRRLYEDFNADYIVLDTRNGGLAILDMLSRTMYDEERMTEYSSLKCMNDDGYANRVRNNNGEEAIFRINANAKLNSDIAENFRRTLIEEKIDLLVNFAEAQEEILPQYKEYLSAIDVDEQLFYENPFLETQQLINESTSLVYEKMTETGVIKVHEQGNNRKDRYTSVSYGDYFASLLEKDLLDIESEYDFGVFIN